MSLLFQMSDNVNIKYDDLAASLECPVCLSVPRELPVPQCPAGHIICKGCRPSLSDCPKCRRRLFPDNSSILAAFLIEKIPHKCKFSDYGCDVKKPLGETVEHEAKCKERTIKCPQGYCQKEIQLKRMDQHALESDCCKKFIFGKDQDPVTFSMSFCSELMENDFEWPFLTYWTKYDKSFYLFQEYISENKSFQFILLMSGPNEDGAEKFKAKLTIYDINEGVENEISFTSPVLPIEDFPKSKDERLGCNKVWKVQREAMLKYFARNINELEGEEGRKKFRLNVSISTV